MGFLDKAKAAAMDLQAKADTALSNSGMMGGNPRGGPGGGGGGPVLCARLGTSRTIPPLVTISCQ